MNKLVKQLYFQQRQDGVYLTVHPLLKGRIDIEDVKADILGRGVVNADFRRIAEVLEEASGEPRRIGDRFIKYDERKDKYIYLRPSEDGVQLLLSVRFPKNEETEILVGDILYNIWRTKVKVPIDEEKIRQIVEEGKSVYNVVVGEGKPPVAGKDARIVFLVDTNISSAPIVREDGSVDFHRLNLIKCVEKDQHLAYKIPRQPGKPGVNIYGDPIPYLEGKDVSLPKGMNTYVSPDELNLYAKCHGHMFFRNGLLHIERVYVVSKDVDFSTGDIEYNGEVIVNRDVKTGFKVETKGNILIRGNVDGATIISKEGSVEIQGGVLGKNLAYISAKKGVKAEFIQYATVESQGDVTVSKYIMHSTVTARGMVKVPHGVIIGGNVTSSRCVVAKEIGAPNSMATKVGIFRSIHPEKWLKAVQLNKRIKAGEKEVEKLQKEIHFLLDLKKRLKELGQEKENELKRLQLLLETRSQEIERLTAEKNEILKDGDEIFEDPPYIQANATIYPGVTIALCQYEEAIKSNIRGIRYLLKENGIEKRTI